jgi:hypothetical protein
MTFIGRANMWRRRLLPYIVLLALLGWAAPRLATPWIAEALTEHLNARGVEVGWQTLQVNWRGLRFSQLEAWAPNRGYAHIDRLTIQWAWAMPPVGPVDLRGVRATVALLERAAPTTGNPPRPRAARALPPVAVHDLRIEIQRNHRPLGRLSAQHAALIDGHATASALQVDAHCGPITASAQAQHVRYAERVLRGSQVAATVHAFGQTMRLQPQPAGVDLRQQRLWARQIEVGPITIEQPTLWRDGAGWSAAGEALGGTLTGHGVLPHFAELRFAHLDTAQLPLALPLSAHAVVDGHLTLLDPLGVGHAEGRLRLRHGTLRHPRIAPEPLDDLHGTLDFVLTRGPFEGATLDLIARRGAVQAHARLTADALTPDATLHLDATLEPVACQRAFDIIPRALLGPYADARMAGTFAPRLSLSLPLDLPIDLRLRIPGLQGACPITALRAAQRPPARFAGDATDVHWLLRPFAHPITYAARPITVGPGQPGYVPLHQLPKALRAVTWLSEDPAFYKVGAVNVHLIQRALKLDLQRGRYVYGASTLPQQLVKNLFLSRRKTLARKVQELVIAARVADVVPKDRILALYLNCIEFAPNVYGIGRAAQHYFGVPASALTPKQAVFLATAKPSPRYAEARRRRGQTPDTPHYRRYMRRLFERLEQVGAVAPSAALDLSPVQLRRGR